MTSKKKILVIQKIHEVGMQLLDNNPNYEYEIIDAEEMITKVDPELLKKKLKTVML